MMVIMLKAAGTMVVKLVVAVVFFLLSEMVDFCVSVLLWKAAAVGYELDQVGMRHDRRCYCCLGQPERF